MDCYQENKFDDELYDQKGDDKQERSDRHDECSEEIGKMNRSPSEFCEVGDKPKADEGTGQKPAPAIRTCDFCGKKFSSGKALGGHRRFHLQALKKEEHTQRVKIRPPKNSKANKDNCDGIKLSALMSDGKLSCYLCNKDFPSKKSLFGHMRSHPNRDWRGVLPPTPSDKHSSSSPNADTMQQNKDDCYVSAVAAPSEPAIDLSKSLASWKKTDKRGRKNIGGAKAAQILVHLSRGVWFCPEFPEFPQDANFNEPAVEAKSPGIPTPCKERKIDEPSTGRGMKKIKVYRRGSMKLGNKTDEDDDCDSDRLNGGKAFSESGDEKVSVNMDADHEEEDANWTKEEYCVKNMKGASDCMNTEGVDASKLQDHASHFDERKVLMKRKKNKKRKKLLLKLKTQDSETEDKISLLKTVKTPDAYKCGNCDKSFPTFQALGGHRSSHNKEKNISTMDERRPPDAVLAEEYSYSNHILQMNENKESEVSGLLVEEADKFSSDTFVTAKAIGHHHMSCSSTGLAETPLRREASTDEASLSQEMGEASQLGPKILDFDLNESYVMQDDENKLICQA